MRALCGLAIGLAAAALARVAPAIAAAPSGAALVRAACLATAGAEMRAFSQGRRAAFVRNFSADAVIVDDTPPFVLAGPGAAGRWYDANRPGVHDVRVSHGPVKEAAVDGAAREFLVLPLAIAGHGPQGGAFAARGYWTGVLTLGSGGVCRIDHLTVTITS